MSLNRNGQGGILLKNKHNFLVLLVWIITLNQLSILCFSPDKEVVWKDCSTLTTKTTSSAYSDTEELFSPVTFEPKDTNITDSKRSLLDIIVNRVRSSRYLNVEHGATTQSITETKAHPTQCAQIKLPLLWDDSSDSRYVNFFVKKIPAKMQPAEGQLWLLQGGPGAAGDAFDSIVINLRDKLDNKFDIMVPDHRGTGRSSLLACSTGSFENGMVDANKCWNDLKSKYSGGLKGWGTTSAARDVLYTYSLTKRANSTLAVYGVSYGTYWLNRILTLSPNTVDITVFDSVVPPEMDFLQRDLHFLETGNNLLQLCQLSEECNGRFMKAFGKSVDSVMLQVFSNQKSKSKGCLSDTYTPQRLTNMFARLITLKDERRLIFPIVYRLNRCNKKDQNWLVNLSDRVIKIDKEAKATLSGSSALFSHSLFELIVMSELVQYPVQHSAQYWTSMFATIPPYFDARLSPGFTERALEYGQDGYTDLLSKLYPTGHTKPVLTIHGGLDPQTPLSLASNWNASYSGNSNHFVLVPNAIHGVLFNSPMINGDSCGMNLTVQFVLKPTIKPSLACISESEDLVTFQFNGSFFSLYTITGYSKDLWEGGPVRTFAKARRLAVAITTVFGIIPCTIGLVISVLVFGIIVVRGWKVGKNEINDQEQALYTSDNVSTHPSESSGRPSFSRSYE